MSILHSANYDFSRPSGSYWEAVCGPRPAPERIEGNDACDVVVIGAGLSGLSTAYHLVKEYGAKVVLIDATAPGWGSSGRSMGLVGFSPMALHAAVISSKAHGSVSDLTNVDRRGAERLREIALNEAITMPPSGNAIISVVTDPKDAEHLEDYSKALRNAGDDSAMMNLSDLRATVIDSPAVAAASISPFGYAINPLAVTREIADRLVATGMRFYTRTRVWDIEERPSSAIVRYKGGTLTCGFVVAATNGYSRGRSIEDLSDLSFHHPVLSCVTRPLTSDELALLNVSGPLILRGEGNLFDSFVLRILNDGRVGFSAVVDDRGSPETALEARRRLRVRMLEVAPALANVEITHLWSSNGATNASRLPMIAPVGRYGRTLMVGGFDFDSSSLPIQFGEMAARYIAVPSERTAMPFTFHEGRPKRIWLGSLRQAWNKRQLGKRYPL